jgi:hypothetical protein
VGLALGFCSRTGSAVAVAVTLAPPSYVGRWAVDLAPPEVPGQVFHVAVGRRDAEAFVRRCVDAVAELAVQRLRELLGEVGPVDRVGVVIGDHPVPDDVGKILSAHPLMHAAEGRLYRDALLDAAAACSLPATGTARTLAAGRLAGDLAGVVAALGSAAGRPWRREHKLAAVAALVADGGG